MVLVLIAVVDIIVLVEPLEGLLVPAEDVRIVILLQELVQVVIAVNILMEQLVLIAVVDIIVQEVL